jgi:hypothetical protein
MGWVTTEDTWLTEAQSLNNAQLVANHFVATGWHPNSVSALCGNMRHESSINPNIWEFGYGHSYDRGYGLVQWTPASKYIDWAIGRGLEWQLGDSQLARIDYEADENIQWIPKDSYGNMTFAQFRSNSGSWSVDYLTEAFEWSYERPAQGPGWESLPDRQAFARKCLIELDWSGSGYIPPDPTDPPPTGNTDKNKALINMFLANTLRGWG